MTDTYDSNVTVPDLYELTGQGLLDNVAWLTPTDDHWKGGIQYDADCGFTSITVSPCISGAPASIATKTSTWDSTHRGARAFTVFGKSNCAPVGSDWWTTGRDRSLRVLRNNGFMSVEATFWTGASQNSPATVYPNLTTVGPNYDETGRILLQPSAINITGAVDIVEALMRIENAFKQCYPGQGFLHVPTELLNALSAQMLVRMENGKLVTWNGNRVIAGKGYPVGIGPGGVAPTAGSAWMFMTSPVFGLRGTPVAFDPVQSFNRSVNTVEFIAEQTYLLAWHCCVVGTQVTLGGELAGAVGTAGPAS
jgi:hypothetical protein